MQLITLYQAHANGFWTNLYRTKEEAIAKIRHVRPFARQCTVYDGVFEPFQVETALEAYIYDQCVYFNPTAIYLKKKVLR